MRRLLIVLLVLLLQVHPLLAQSGDFIFVDEIGDLNRNQIERAAQPLVRRGASVAIFRVEEGGADDFVTRLRAAGLARSSTQVDPDMIAVYVSTDPNYSEIWGGDSWNAALGVNDNAETLRTTALNPKLASGDMTGAFVDTLGAIENAIVNPPKAGGGNIFNINFIPLIIGGFSFLFLLLGGGAFMRWNANQKTLRQARNQHDRQKEAAGVGIADLAQALDNAKEKARFDSISYAQADVQQLSQSQQQVEQQFQQLQLRFSEIEDEFNRHRKPNVAEYTTAASAYEQVATEIAQVRSQLAEIENKRLELDRLAQQAPQEIDQSKKV